MSLGQRCRAATALCVAAFLFHASPAAAGGPDMNVDFANITDWLSHEVSQGLGFNAGETFDPPREIFDRRLEPDISLGGGVMPLNKTTFPVMGTPALQAVDPQSVFPSSVMFPNFTMHLRAGLPGRSDFALRFADMTSPPGYKLSGNTSAAAQSNSIGVTLRKHLFGGELPLLSLGAAFNHVYGRFEFKTKMMINPGLSDFTADTPVDGGLYWNVSSYGLNAVLSQTFGLWTPFAGFGANYVTGSVRARLDARPETDLIDPASGQSSSRPEKRNGRALVGLQLNQSWVNFFTSGEIKTSGAGRGKAWIVQSGMSLPFRIGSGSGAYAAREREQRAQRLAHARASRAQRVAASPTSDDNGWIPRPAPTPAPRREMFGGPVREKVDGTPTMIFIQ